MQFTPGYYSGLDKLPPEYASLFSERADLRFDQSLPWLRRLADLFALQNGEITIIGLSSNGQPVAALPLIKRPAQGLGADLQSAANFYTAYYGPVMSPSASPADVGDALADALVRLPSRWQVLDLNPMDPDSALFAGLAAGLRRRGAVVEPYFRFGNWYEEVGGRSYEQYHGGRPTQVRETVRRKGRKLDKDTAREFQIITTPEDVDAAMNDYEAIYAKSWKQPEPHLDFLRNVAKDFAAAGWLRLGMLRVDGRPAAAQMWFVFSGTASIFKLAYDPDFQQYSVGSLLTSHLMDYVISNDRVQTIDYLCGDDPYKKDWMSQRRERWGLRAFRLRSLRGLAGAAHAFAGRIARSWRARQAIEASAKP